MTAFQKMKSYIRKVYRTTKKPIDALEKWRKRPDKREGKIKRTKALQQWARQQQEAAQSAKGRAKWKALRYRYKAKIEWLETHKDPAPAPPNLVSFDGHSVPGWIVEILQEARSSGAWRGVVFSGFRSPAYSTSLCMGYCGHPTCTNCAGAGSNHACPPTGTGTPYEGAIDVTDPYNLERFCRAHNKPLYGGGYALSGDDPHFSHTGR